MELVSERSDAEIAQHQALEDLCGDPWALAANIMRLSRGAGKPWELDRQMSACLDHMIAHRDAAGCGVSSYDLHDQELVERHRPVHCLLHSPDCARSLDPGPQTSPSGLVAPAAGPSYVLPLILRARRRRTCAMTRRNLAFGNNRDRPEEGAPHEQKYK